MNWKSIRLWPVLLAIGFVPLIVTAKIYNHGLDGLNWFSTGQASADLFLYWKGQTLIALAFIMLLFAFITTGNKKALLPEWSKIKTLEMLCVCAYLLLAFLSALFSANREYALWGGYEQWEGINVIFAYCVLFAYMYLMVDSEATIKLVIYSIIIGSLVIGLIGTGQFLQHDLFRSEFGQTLMNFMSDQKMRFSFNFENGRSYSTLYNPNYIGSYVALVLPVLVTVSVLSWKKISPAWSIMAMISVVLNIVTLAGSQSLTGCIGIVVAAVFVLVYRFPRIFNSLGGVKIAIAGVVCIGLIVSLCFVFPDELKMVKDKLFTQKESRHVTQKLLSTDKGLEITTVNDDVFYLNLTEDLNQPFSVVDAEGNAVALMKDASKGYFYSEDKRLDEFRLGRINVTVENAPCKGVQILNPWHYSIWNIVKVDNEFKYYTEYQKLDSLEDIEAFGFEKNQYFGSRRGYIWSRTFPLLKKNILIGSGPNTFIFEFPNNDYVGKNKMDYAGVTVTKPHNMYLQTWVQTGLLSLIAFLLVFFLYFIKSLKLYWNRALETIPEKLGLAIMVSIFGYMVTGIANDSCVAVAPVFWGLLGLGYAVNKMVGVETKR